jgi:hypothetical protein
MENSSILNRAGVYGDKAFWVRPEDKRGFDKKETTSVFRLNDRSKESSSGNIPMHIALPVRFIEKPGDPSKDVDAVLYPDDGTTVEITGCTVTSFANISKDDLSGSGMKTKDELRNHLFGIYKTNVNEKTLVTRWDFVYLPKITE